MTFGKTCCLTCNTWLHNVHICSQCAPHTAVWQFIPNNTKRTFYSTQYTLLATFCTLHHNAHLPLHIAHCTLHSTHCTLNSVNCTLKKAHCTLLTVQFTLHIVAAWQPAKCCGDHWPPYKGKGAAWTLHNLLDTVFYVNCAVWSVRPRVLGVQCDWSLLAGHSTHWQVFQETER